ncbi:hypothetical protein N7508_004765 [Penicillium antarcticum]|uniref:uncharacterized protein n=1 Tax=Penicillium antarcticum TaxID=416450 RepID=UPI0023A2D593|nr:uncharacterized protein N7508_004765 [Penicillium antarcticum]KAJ5305750.1 hypothetical protein N7508_004765 [Penicillium antarcticum]
MAWPCHGGEDSPDMKGFDLLRRSTIYDLLKETRIPFVSTVDTVKPCTFGVVLITSVSVFPTTPRATLVVSPVPFAKHLQIPYGITRQEVTSFLGSEAQWLANHNGACPIHIMMERSTGKTMDCYIEFVSEQVAARVAYRLGNAYDAYSSPRMGNRHVEISFSNQDALLKAMFPLAKCVKWVNGSPVILEGIPEWSSGFDGFLTGEELYCLGRHSDTPYRSVFANRVPQRCYESLISTIWKFPWYATGMYTVHDRNQLFELLKQMVDNLRATSQKETRTVGLDERLLRELTWCGILCPGFNPRQKYNIASKSQLPEFEHILDHDWCQYFPFDTLGYADEYSLLDYQIYAYLTSQGELDRINIENEGYHNGHIDPRVRRLFGVNWFSWRADTAKLKLFKDAVDYEKCLLRQLVITGYRSYHAIPRGDEEDSSSSIGTAPPDTPTVTVTEKSFDSQKTISAFPRAAPIILVPPPRPPPDAPPISARTAQVLAAPFNRRTQAAQQTGESGSLQSRTLRHLSAPDFRFSAQPSSSSPQQVIETVNKQAHLRRNMSTPEQSNSLVPCNVENTESGSSRNDDGSSKESVQTTPRLSRVPLNYTDVNFHRPISPQETRSTSQGVRPSGQLEVGETYSPFNSIPEPHMSNFITSGEFDREWRFPYTSSAMDVPPPSFIPYRRAMPRSASQFLPFEALPYQVMFRDEPPSLQYCQAQQSRAHQAQSQEQQSQDSQDSQESQESQDQQPQNQQHQAQEQQSQKPQCQQYPPQMYLSYCPEFQDPQYYQASCYPLQHNLEYQQLQYEARQLQSQYLQAQQLPAKEQRSKEKGIQDEQATPVPRYRTPHHRATSSTYSQIPTYYVPHATAQNIRSHSDPFAPGPYEPASARSRSDMLTDNPPVNTPFFDSVRQGQRQRRTYQPPHNSSRGSSRGTSR